MTQPNPKADSQSPTEGLRQHIAVILEDLASHYEVDAIMELVTAYAATVEREAETTGALNVLELLAKDGTISEMVKLKMLDTVFEWERLAALQGPQDGDD